ncbi:MAG: hypothetical protein H6551_10070 [Chitinophagales bacterium]|nr:hypothetical protein [Chitinophagales bacterium]
MDPNLFHIDYDRLLEILITIVVFSFFIERALSVVFESRFFIDRTEAKPEQPEVRDDNGNIIEEAKPAKEKKKGVKELIAIIVSIAFCYYWQFDAITILLASNDTVTLPGMILTAAIIAGGSKASVALFKDLLGFMSSAEKERKERKKNQTTS